MLLLDFLEATRAAADREHIWRFPKQDVELSLGDIVTASGGYAGALAALGVCHGDRVGIVLENCAEYPSLLLGIWQLGAAAVPLRPSGGLKFEMAAFLREVDADCEFAVFVFDDDVDPPVMAASSRRRGVRKAQIRELAATAPSVVPARLRPEDVAVLQYSSGSTARPKAVIVTHGMVRSQVDQLDSEYRYACGGESIRSAGSWLPFHHDMGLFIGILHPLFSRSHNVLGSPLFYMRDPKRWFRLQAERRVNWNFTTNLAMANSVGSLRLLDPAAVDLSHFHLYLAAEKVSPVVLQKTCDALERLGTPRANVRIGYGMAENTLGVTSTKDGHVRCVRIQVDGTNRLRLADGSDPRSMEVVSVGRPHINTTVTVRDDDGNVVPDVTLGEICVEGPCVTPGYFRDPTRTAAQLTGGFLRTRDLGFRLDDEFYFVTRKDDVVVVGGRNISPDDIEDCVEAMDNVPAGGAVLIDVPIAATGKTELVLLVETNQRLSGQEAAERRALLQQHVLTERGLLINRVAFAKRSSLEKTSSGKKRRKVIRERFVNQELDLS
ncbi:MAG: AMP-binding protein [Polyangiaceae bacterium]|jgi:fatty-acyl-CoA synthase